MPTLLSEKQCLTSLKRHWGYDKLREQQHDICQAVLAGRDVFVLMATGSGKSLSYQLPPVMLRDTGVQAWSLVICPLISLAEDQVAELNAIGIPAALVGGNSTIGVETQVREGKCCVVYITPEKLLHWRSQLRDLAKRQHLTCIAVDEAHCVSEWGHDFRPSYRALHDVRDSCFPNTPLLALTATATHAVTKDISTALQMRNPLVIRTTFNRPNLFYAVKQRFSDKDVATFVKKYFVEALGGPSRSATTVTTSVNSSSPVPSVLIYVNTQQDAERVARSVQDAVQAASAAGAEAGALERVVVGYYHAGMSATARSRIHQAFCRDEAHVMVATVAFGMGINKPDVRLIVHCEMPHSVEAYYQQTGRAGRDGFPSKCVLFYHRNDMVKLHGIQHYKSTAGAGSASSSTDKLTCMSNYCSSNPNVIKCRRIYLLSYFDDAARSPLNAKGIHCCDLCQVAEAQATTAAAAASTTASTRLLDSAGSALAGEEAGWISSSRSAPSPVQLEGGVVDLGHEILLFLRAVQECGGYFGLSAAVGVVTGSKDKSLLKIPGFPDRLQTFGKGSRHPKAWWTELGHVMVEEDLLATQMVRGGGGGGKSFSYQRFFVGSEGKVYLQGHRAVPTSMLMNLSAAREAAAKPGTRIEPSPTMPSRRTVEASKAFRIQLQFSPAFSSAVQAVKTIPATGPHSTTSISGTGGLKRRMSTTSSALATFKTSSHEGNNGSSQHQQMGGGGPAFPQGGPGGGGEGGGYDSETLAQLEGRLRQTRGEFAEALKLRPYNILSTEDLKNLLHYRPVDVKELHNIPGWGMQKIQKFGHKFVSCITVFMKHLGFPVLSNMPAPLASVLEKSESHEGCLVERLSPDEEGSSKLLATIAMPVPVPAPAPVPVAVPLGEIADLPTVSVKKEDSEDPESMWTISNPFRQASCKAEREVEDLVAKRRKLMPEQSDFSGNLQPPPQSALEGSHVSTLKAEATGNRTETLSRPKVVVEEEDVSVHIDMFGPVKIAVVVPSSLPVTLAPPAPASSTAACAPSPLCHSPHPSTLHPSSENSSGSKCNTNANACSTSASSSPPLPPSRGHPSAPSRAAPTLKRKRSQPMMNLVGNKSNSSSTRLKKTTSLPQTTLTTAASSAPASLQHMQQPTPHIVHVEADTSSSLLGLRPPTPSQLEATVLEFLMKHPMQTFSAVLCGVLGGTGGRSMELKLQYAPLVREAISSLSNDFCIYIDGDKYSAL